MNWPRCAVLLVTYDRLPEIRRTIGALLKHLKYKGDLHWHIADDATPEPYLNDISDSFQELLFSFTQTPRGGWGRNVNAAMAEIKEDYIFLCEDDYVAKKDINLTRGVALLEEVKAVGLVRYDGVAAHAFNLKLREANTTVGHVPYMIIDKDSPHLNVYSNRPHLKHRRFHKHYGIYPTKKNLGDTETIFAHRVKDMDDGPHLAILEDGIVNAFDHIGRTRQGTAHDRSG